MPCSKPIRRKYSKNEVILPSDRRGSMVCHAVHVSWCTKAMRVSLLRQKQYYVVWDDGEPKCEIMVASSVWEGAALWFDVSLLITTTGPVRVGCVPLLFCTIIWCLTRRPGCYMSHMSATGSTKFMKGSVDGGVYYRIHERERLSFGKICFYGVRTH